MRFASAGESWAAGRVMPGEDGLACLAALADPSNELTAGWSLSKVTFLCNGCGDVDRGYGYRRHGGDANDRKQDGD